MIDPVQNWTTQIRKGYLELCILALIRRHKRLYGFEIVDLLSKMSLEVKEGTLYPLLNRMAAEKQLDTVWDVENLKGHPRKFYSLSKAGEKLLNEMSGVFDGLVTTYKRIVKDV